MVRGKNSNYSWETIDFRSDNSMTEIDGSAIDDILNSPTKENQPPAEEPIEPIATAPIINEDSIAYPELNQDDLPGSIENIPNLEEKRPSTTLEVGPDGVAMVESSALPARLPPLRNSSQEGDLDGYRQNIDVISNFSEVILNSQTLVHLK